MKKLILLFFLLTSCSLNSDNAYWNENLNINYEELKYDKGTHRTKVGLPLLFSKPTKQGEKINWLGIIAAFNIAFCLTGFFLFKDK